MTEQQFRHLRALIADAIKSVADGDQRIDVDIHLHGAEPHELMAVASLDEGRVIYVPHDGGYYRATARSHGRVSTVAYGKHGARAEEGDAA